MELTDKMIEDAAECAGSVVAIFANGGNVGLVLEKATQEIQQYAEAYHAKECAKCKDMILDDMRHSRGDYSRFEKRSGITTDVGADE